MRFMPIIGSMFLFIAAALCVVFAAQRFVLWVRTGKGDHTFLCVALLGIGLFNLLLGTLLTLNQFIDGITLT